MAWGAILQWAIPAIISAFSAYQGNKDAKDANKQAGKLIDSQIGRNKEFDIFGKALTDQGVQNMGIFQNYLRQAGSPNRGAVEQAIAPELNAMTDQYRGGIAASRGMFPRGQSAGGASMLQQQLQSGMNNAIFGARPNALAQLGQLGQNQTSLGLGSMGQGAGLTNSMLDYGLRARDQMFGQGMALGQGAMNTAMMAYMMRPQQNAQTVSPYIPAGGSSATTAPYNPQGSGYNLYGSDQWGKGPY